MTDVPATNAPPAGQPRLDVVLPAGGRIAGHFAETVGTDVKALIEIRGETLLEHVLGCLRASDRIGRLVVIGSQHVADHPAARLADVVLPEGDSGADNCRRGFEWLREANGGQPTGRVMVCTTDLPILTTEAIEAFLDACPPEAGVCGSVMERRDFEAAFPGFVKTFVPLKDGAFRTGGAFLIDPESLERRRAEFERIFSGRKQHLVMARLLGFSFLLRFALRQLTLAQVQRRCEQILGRQAYVWPACPPALALDIDHEKDYWYALGLTEDRRPETGD